MQNRAMEEYNNQPWVEISTCNPGTWMAERLKALDLPGQSVRPCLNQNNNIIKTPGLVL